LTTNQVTIKFVGDASGLTSSAQQATAALGGVGTAAKTTQQGLGGLNTSTQQAGNQIKDFSSGTTALAQALGTNYKSAQQFAQGLGLTGQQATAAIGQLRSLNSVNATTSERFQTLGKELGITQQQFRALDAAAKSGGFKGFINELQQATAQAALSSQAIGQLAGTMTQAGQKVNAVSGAALQAAAGYDKAKTKTSTLTDDTQALEASVASLSDELKRQVSPTELLNASYDVLSSGFTKTGDATQVLSAATKGAIGGFSDVNTVSDALTSTLNAYGLGADQAASVTDKFIATQNAGKIVVNEYAQQIGKVAPLAAQAGVGLDELNGFIATATIKGVKAEATFAGIRQGIAAVLKPTDEASKLADQLGISFDSQALKTKGLSGIIGELNAKGLDTPEILTKLFGSVEAVAAIAPSTGQGFKLLQDNIKASTDSAGAADIAFQKVSNSFEGQTKSALTELNTALVSLGNGVTTAITPIVGALVFLLKNFNALPEPIKGVIGVLLAAAGGALTLGGALLTVAAIVPTISAGLTVIAGALAGTGAAGGVAAGGLGATGAAGGVAGAGLTTAAAGAGALQTVLIAALPAVLAIAGALAAVALVANTYSSITAGSQKLQESTNSVTDALGKYREAQIAAGKATEESGKAADLQTAFQEKTKEQIGGIQQALDVLRNLIANFSLQKLFEEFSKLDALPGPLRDILSTIANTLPKVSTAQEAASNASKVAFGDLIGSADQTLTAFEQARAKGFKNLKGDEIKALSAAIDASAKSVAGATAQDDVGAAAKSAYGKSLASAKSELDKLSNSNLGAAKTTDKLTQSSADRKKAIESEAEAEAKRREAEKGQQEQNFQDTKTKDDQSFQDAKAKRESDAQAAKEKREQAFQDAKEKRDQANADAKQQREEAFQTAKAAREQSFADAKQQKEDAFQTAKQGREQAFQDAQRQKDETYQSQKQQKDQAFQDRQRQADQAFQESQRRKEQEAKDAQQKRDEAQQQAFTEADRLIKADGASPEIQNQLAQQKVTAEAIAKLNLANQAIDPAQIVSLAKQVSGIGTPANDADRSRLADAAKQIEAEQKKQQAEADKEAERQRLEEQKAQDEAFKQQQREEERAYKEQQQAEDKAFEATKREEDRAFKAAEVAEDRAFKAQEKADDQAFKAAEKAQDKAFKDQEKAADQAFKASEKAADRAFKDQEKAIDTAFKASELEKERAFKDQEREKERAFKAEQRSLDEASAEKVKSLKKSADTPTLPTPTPRKLGGPVQANQLYLVGEAGPEYLVPSHNGYILNHRESLALAESAFRQPPPPMPSISLSTSPADNAALLAEFRHLTAAILEDRTHPRHLHVHGVPAPAETAAGLYANITRRRVRRSGL
jgi:TP901 family phage tail tape measure protein